MRFYVPSDIYVEKNCVANHKKDIIAMGSRAFIVTGRHSARINGSLEDVTSALTDGDIPYEIFGGKEEIGTLIGKAERSVIAIKDEQFGAQLIRRFGGNE